MISSSDKPEVREAKPEVREAKPEVREAKSVLRPGWAATGQLGKWVKRAGYVVKELASDAPEAARREWNYYREHHTSAILALTWACTSRCKTCTIWCRNRRQDEELTIGEWLDAGNTLAGQGIEWVELFGGDVFLRPELTVKLSALLKARGCKVAIPTNSHLLTREMADELVRSVHVFYLSTDGLDDLHDEVRGISGAFGKVLRAIDYLVEARGSRSLPRLVCNTTVSRYNCRTLAKIAEFAKRRGFDEIHLEYVGEFTDEHVCTSRIGAYRPKPLYMRNGDSALLTSELVPVMRKQLKQARTCHDQPSESGRRFKVRTASTDVLSDINLVRGTVPGRRCFFERMTRVIDPYGNIAPCLFFDTYSLGNVRNGDLLRAVKTAHRMRFRRLRDSGQLELCRHCIMSVVRNRTGRDVLRRAILDGRRLLV